MVRAIRTDQMIDLIPVIEPGTEMADAVAGILKGTFRGQPVIDGSSADQLKSLDVIACPRVWNQTPEVMEAIKAAVSEGTGLLIWSGLASITPGAGEIVAQLNGLQEGQYAWNPQAVECEVMVDHLLLGKLTKGQIVSLEPNGMCGILGSGASGLIRVKSENDYHPTAALATTRPAEYAFHPLYISTLGKGRIVGCDFPAWRPVPGPLQNATGGKFLIRCVRWAADRTLD